MHLHTPFNRLTASDKVDASLYSRAMALAPVTLSDEAEVFVSMIMNTVIQPLRDSRRQGRPTMRPKCRQALASLLEGVLSAYSVGRWGRCATGSSTMVFYPGGKTAFQTVREAMKAAGLLEDLPGVRMPAFHGAIATAVRQRQTCFRPTPALLSKLKAFDIPIIDVRDHFRPADCESAVPLVPVELRAQKAGDKPSVRLPLDTTDASASAQLARMAGLNAFLLTEGRVSGFRFGGLRRIFNDADQPGFRWQWGGRFYSSSRSEGYENFPSGKNPNARPVPPGEARSERIRLDGHSVVEVDMNAAHLTLLYGLCGASFDHGRDPYDIEGSSREDVKTWVRTAMGAGNMTIGGKRFAKARKAALSRHPILTRAGEPGMTTLDLQFHESEIILSALEVLRDRHGVAALPLHDALIVPENKAVLAQSVLSAAFQRYFRETLLAPIVPTPRIHVDAGRSLVPSDRGELYPATSTKWDDRIGCLVH